MCSYIIMRGQMDILPCSVMICTVVCINVNLVAHAVTFRGNVSEMFQGFLVVAMNILTTQRVGSFTSGGADSKTTCSVSMHKCLRQSQKH